MPSDLTFHIVGCHAEGEVGDAASCGVALVPDEAHDLAETGMRITRAANAQLGFAHPGDLGRSHTSFCRFTRPVEVPGGAKTGRNTVAIEPGKLDRSPTGTGCSAHMAVLAARPAITPRFPAAPRSPKRASSCATPPTLRRGRLSTK